MSAHTHADRAGYFGPYGGAHLPPALIEPMAQVAQAYEEARVDPAFVAELERLLADYVGRPSPLFLAENLTRAWGGARVYLKREDLNHTGAHKINHCLGEALLAKRMGKRCLIAETGAGQHGVAVATAAALLGLECEVHMGEIDVAKQRPNVVRMELLGARVVPVASGGRNLKDAVDSAFAVFAERHADSFYAIGSAVGPHPFPSMVRDFQSIVGREARRQFLDREDRLPDALVAAVGGGSNAIGLFIAFLDDEDVALHGVEPAGRGLARPGDHAATIALGVAGRLHGMDTIVLSDSDGSPWPVHSMASGLDYPGVGPQHAWLHETGRATYVTVDDEEALSTFVESCRAEGIIPALESAHALAHAKRLAAELGEGKAIVVNLSGRGDKDVDYVAELLAERG